MNTKKEISWKGKLAPTFVLTGTQPMPLTAAQVRRVVDAFLKSDGSSHSAQGATLWALLDFLQGKKIPYLLTAHPGEGYYVQRLDPLPKPQL